MTNSTDGSTKYYNEEAKAKIEERKALWNPELETEVTQQWTALIADITAALGEDPAEPAVQALATR